MSRRLRKRYGHGRGPNTPGYNTRLFIARTVDKNGKPVAYYWSGQGNAAPGTLGRWIKMSMARALEFLERGEADPSPYIRWGDPSPPKGVN